MKKLAVDEIIGGLIESYEKLLILATNTDYDPAEYHHVLGEVTALRWVLGQYPCSLNTTSPDNTIKEEGEENE